MSRCGLSRRLVGNFYATRVVSSRLFRCTPLQCASLLLLPGSQRLSQRRIDSFCSGTALRLMTGSLNPQLKALEQIISFCPRGSCASSSQAGSQVPNYCRMIRQALAPMASLNRAQSQMQ